MRYYWRFISHQ